MPDHQPTLTATLNNMLRELLAQRDWSQREFAERLGMSQGAVSYLLHAKRRANVLDYYERLAAIFEIPLYQLLYEAEARRAPQPLPSLPSLPRRAGDRVGRSDLINGLIEALPKPGADWPLDARQKWLQLAESIFEFVYKTNEA